MRRSTWRFLFGLAPGALLGVATTIALYTAEGWRLDPPPVVASAPATNPASAIPADTMIVLALADGTVVGRLAPDDEDGWVNHAHAMAREHNRPVIVTQAGQFVMLAEVSE